MAKTNRLYDDVVVKLPIMIERGDRAAVEAPEEVTAGQEETNTDVIMDAVDTITCNEDEVGEPTIDQETEEDKIVDTEIEFEQN